MPFSSRCSATTKNSPPKGVLPPSPLPILFLLAFFPQFCPAQFQFQLDGPQPCPENPIRLMAQKYPQYVYSPYDEHRLYPPDTDCQFLIEAGGQSNRILLSVLESELEEPIFTECNDFVSIQDKEGNGSSWKEIVRWCGQDFPSAITSVDDSILVHFHSDSIIQKRGFNISFVQFELPGCPPEWKWDASSPFCYKQFILPHILPWADAQKECTFERANLAVFQNDQDYAFIVEQFSQTHSFPWIGYSDAIVEGVFEAADKSSPIWPENFPLRQENEMKDCVYLDWNKRDQFVHYEIDDCRVRRPFLCKRRKDGTDHPTSLPPGLIRRGLGGDFSIDHTLLVGVIILLLLALIVGCVFYQKFKERSRVMNVDLNQRLVQHQQQGAGGSSTSILGSKRGLAPAKSLSGQKAVAAAALAKEKEKERREREQRYEQKGTTGKNGATTQKPVLETQDSSTSFPLQTLQGFSRTFQQIETISSHQREQVVEGAAMESPPPQSPRISLSPNQPEMEEKREERGKEEEEEEEEERANMGYEPDSEEEESGKREGMGRRGKGKEKEENGKEEKEEKGEEEGGMGKVEMDKGKEEGEKEAVGGGGTEEMLGKFQQAAPVSEHPLRPPIELIMRGGEQRKEETEGPNREATMLSTGVESGTGTGATGNRMRRRKSFDRPPPIGPLDNVSAISLDEFWQQNQK